MGWFKKKFKQATSAVGITDFKDLLNPMKLAAAPFRAEGQLLDEASRVTGATQAYQNVSGHTAKAEEDTRARLATANAKALAEANSAVNKDTADVILGATDSTAGDSLDTLRKRKQISGASMVGIV